MTTHTPEEKAKGKKVMLLAGMLAGGLLGTLLVIGFPSSLWSPAKASDFLRGLLCVLLFAATGAILVGAWPVLEDWEVRTHKGSGPIVNPVTVPVLTYGSIALVVCVVIIVRYAYLQFLPASEEFVDMPPGVACYLHDARTVPGKRGLNGNRQPAILTSVRALTCQLREGPEKDVPLTGMLSADGVLGTKAFGDLRIAVEKYDDLVVRTEKLKYPVVIERIEIHRGKVQSFRDSLSKPE